MDKRKHIMKLPSELRQETNYRSSQSVLALTYWFKQEPWHQANTDCLKEYLIIWYVLKWIPDAEWGLSALSEKQRIQLRSSVAPLYTESLT